MRSEDFEEKECVSLKQENEEARVLTSCEAEREEDSIKAVGEQENLWGGLGGIWKERRRYEIGKTKRERVDGLTS